MIESPEQVAEVVAWLNARSIDQVFVIAGDAPEPRGPYHDAASLLAELFAHPHGLTTVGITGYPDGHGFIDEVALRRALHDKQDLFAAAGVAGAITTQMCFDPTRIVQWLETERAAGMHLPVHIGIPGVVERTRLMKMGIRLGVGTSLRYLKKNRAAVSRIFSPAGYDPSALVTKLAGDAERLDIVGFHSFTFNSVEATRGWQTDFTSRSVQR